MASSNEKPVFTRAQMKYVWMAVAVVVLIGAFGITPWDAIEAALEGEAAGRVAFVAGFALPLVVGTAAAVGFILWNRAHGKTLSLGDLGVVGGILIAAGFLSHWLGLGLAPDFTAGRVYGGFPWFMLSIPLTAYINTYGVGLTLAAASIGSAVAWHVDLFRTDPGAIVEDTASLFKPE